jgi:hypothetical protein
MGLAGSPLSVGCSTCSGPAMLLFGHVDRMDQAVHMDIWGGLEMVHIRSTCGPHTTLKPRG